MSSSDVGPSLEEITRDLDLVVFRLERAPPEGISELLHERQRLLKELESLRDRLEDLSRSLR